LKTDSRGNILRFKARLVAKGYSQRPGEDFTETFAPVARFATIRVMLTLAAAEGWCIKHLDVKTAFLHGRLQEEIYMEQPAGFQIQNENGTELSCRLTRSLYGLKQASRAWHERLREELLDLGLTGADEDPSLFYAADRKLFLLIYVDDMLVMGESGRVEEIQEGLARKFQISELGEASYFLGLALRWDRRNGQVEVNQSKYAEEVLKRFDGSTWPHAPGLISLLPLVQ
jgi:hypothetical protein